VSGATPRVSVITPAHNSEAFLGEALRSVEAQTYGDWEVVVADDASTDETRDIERLVTGVRVVRSETNRGFIETCNAGARAARGDYVVFLNNDTFVSQVHARLFRRGRETYVEDLGSTNGTLVNGERISEVTRLRRGDQVQFGSTLAEITR